MSNEMSGVKIEVYAPASVANICVGFDCLGAALAPIDGSMFGDTVAIEKAKAGITLEVKGAWVAQLPDSPTDNIVYQCAEFFMAQLKQATTGIKLTLTKQLPVGSGLGSSASSVVAALFALNEYFERPFTEQGLLQLMGKFEGQISGDEHYDNVAPCYLGQLQLILTRSHQSQGQICAAIPHFKHWYWVMAYSGVALSTAKMRQLLPEQYDKSTSIAFGRQLSSFVHACYQQDEMLAFEVLEDVLAEPYRAAYIPGYLDAKAELTRMGMQATGISGSGPSLFSITPSLEKARQAQHWLNRHYLQTQDGFSHICQIDQQGARRC